MGRENFLQRCNGRVRLSALQQSVRTLIADWLHCFCGLYDRVPIFVAVCVRIWRWHTHNCQRKQSQCKKSL